MIYSSLDDVAINAVTVIHPVTCTGGEILNITSKKMEGVQA
jgi:hypothetical protein